uniref:Putative secreted protein n=1 Tax=Xenopsylla cheopis TaxID=163159 RepID=A0A6M2DZI0_XENCH
MQHPFKEMVFWIIFNCSAIIFCLHPIVFAILLRFQTYSKNASKSPLLNLLNYTLHYVQEGARRKFLQTFDALQKHCSLNDTTK